MDRHEKITKRSVDAAKPTEKRYRIRDTELTGFSVRVMPSGVKVYKVVYRANGGGRGETPKEYTIGQHGVFTPEEARKEAERLLSSVRLGTDPQDAKAQKRKEMTVAELCDFYLEEGTTTKKASTLKSDGYRINRHIKPLLGKLKISEVNSSHIERFLRDVAAGKHGGRKPSKVEAKRTGLTAETRGRTDSNVRGGKGTATRTVITLSGIFTFAVKRKLRSDHPCRGVETYKAGKSERHLSLEELKRLGQVMDLSHWNATAVAIIRCLILTGCRKGEIEHLRRDAVDFSNHFLKLSDSKTGPKVVPVGLPALELLRPYVNASVKSEFVFPSAVDANKPFIGTPKIWTQIKLAADLPKTTLHDLRHTFASLAIEDGKTLPIIGKILGHSDIKTTERYAHLTDTSARRAANDISVLAANALSGALLGPSTARH
ncbi:phage integrase family protein [Asticcacaulis biprosthecium C19]|uniref:Phage integrase family protein n=1 Tax=Asticcacaulis biprosthecium C19 TaxID=715226 RepID=F4QP19_9CAUL|nr:site-specific integrase [Asticcacaulis biprosthecium]EGF91077.1 phage integrase family protein [Asticcacaulis biprosthecium C19]